MTYTPQGYIICIEIPRMGIIVTEEKMNGITTCECSEKRKERTEKEKRELMNRLKRIEGQVRGVENMLDNNVYCTDIITQVAAINAALNSFNKVLLAEHIKTCVADNIRTGNDDVTDELVSLIQKLMK